MSDLKVTFARAPFSNQAFTKEQKAKFDDLPAWQRNLIDRIIVHGDFEKACKESNLPTKGEVVDLDAVKSISIVDALEKGGINSLFIVEQLKECLEAKVFKIDKHGNPYHDVKDLKLKLESLKLIMQLRGDFDTHKKEDKNTQKFMELFGHYKEEDGQDDSSGEGP